MQHHLMRGVLASIRTHSIASPRVVIVPQVFRRSSACVVSVHTWTDFVANEVQRLAIIWILNRKNPVVTAKSTVGHPPTSDVVVLRFWMSASGV